MINRRSLLSLLGAAGLVAVPRPGRRAGPPRSHLQRPHQRRRRSLPPLARQVAVHQPRELHRRQRPGRPRHDRHGRQRGARPWPGLEDLAVGEDRAQAGLHAGRDHRARRDSTHLDDAHRPLALLDPARLLGRRDDALHRGARRRLLRVGLGPLRATQLAGRRGESRQRVQLLLGDAVPEVVPHHDGEHRRPGDDALLPDRLLAHRGGRRRRVPARAVPAGEPAAVQAGLHDRGRREGRGPVRRHAPVVGRQQHRLVGRGRDQVLPRRRHRLPDHLRDRHRGLLLRVCTTSRTRRPSSTRSSRRRTRGCRW